MASFERPASTSAADRDLQQDQRLNGEIAVALSDIARRYNTSRSQLAWKTLTVLRQQIDRDEGLAAYLTFTDKAASIMQDELDSITAILNEDDRRQAP